MTGKKDDIERVLLGTDPDEAHDLRELWDAAASLDPDADPIDAHEVGRISEDLQELARRTPDRLRIPNTLRETIHRNGRATGRWHSASRRWGVITSFAVAAVLASVAVVAWWSVPVRVQVPAGSTRVLTLPDGSTVQINGASSVSYGRGFNLRQSRAVDLEGEAFFTVSNDGPPFVVATRNARVGVLGTSFNVRSRRYEPDVVTVVAVQAGRVSLAPASDPGRVVVLSAGQTRRVADTGRSARVDSVASSVVDAMAWTRGDFVVRDEPLQVMLNEIESRYGVEISTSGRLDATGRWSLAVRRPESPERIVRDIAGMVGVQYRQVAGGFELVGEAWP